VNGIHDMGGMQDMGPVRPEKNEPVFHAPWERRIFGIWMAVDGDWSDYDARYQKEQIPPVEYLRMSYYERVMTGLVGMMLKSGMVTQSELDTGTPIQGTTKPKSVLSAAEVPSAIAKGSPAILSVSVAPHFQAGQRVRARNINPVGHTRLPRYTRGKLGTIERDHGVFAFPDAQTQGLGDKPQHVYGVRFSARELWGKEASQHDSVYVAMWDDYLEPA